MQRAQLPFARAGVIAAVLIGTAQLPARAQRLVVEVRAGLAASTALAEDAVANPGLRAQLGASFNGPVRAVPAPGPALVVAAIGRLRARTRVELAAGWTFTRLDADNGTDKRDIQDIGVGHAMLGIRYLVTGRLDAGCGFGAAHYAAEDRGLFTGGTAYTPLLECGAGPATAGTGRRLVLRASAQAQRFRTGVLSDAASRTGTVLRFVITAGIAAPIR